MKILSTKDGFPELPTIKRSILVSPDASHELAEAMEAAIRKAV